MAQTIEDVNGRTLLQQFHGLYKKQQEQQASIEQNASEIATKQNALTPGTNITITDNTISAVAHQNMMTTDTLQDFTQPKTFKAIGNENVKITFGGLLNGNSITAKDESHSYEKTYVFKGGDEMLKVENVETEEHAESTYQKKLTAGTNITIDSNNVISASGGLQEVKANNVNSETATQGQVLTANGSGGASWQTSTGGGDKVYRHHIRCYSATGKRFYIDIPIITNNSTVIDTFQLLLDMMEQNGFIDRHQCQVINHTFFDMKGDGTPAIATGILKISDTELQVFGFSMGIDNNAITVSNATNIFTSFTTISDAVTEI